MTYTAAPDQAQGLLTVCGGRIEDPDEFPSTLFQGEKVYFCHPACLRAFLKDPLRFMAGEIEHPPEDDPLSR
jgi:YHS domain-containing protein